MRINLTEKIFLIVILFSASTAGLAAYSSNASLFSPLAQIADLRQAGHVGAQVRGLAEPLRISTEKLVRRERGKVIKVDSAGGMVVKGTMHGAEADSYQTSGYLNANNGSRIASAN